MALGAVVAPEVAEDLSAQYGFLLHDVGKIGVPDEILLKPGPLTAHETRVMRMHTLLGEQMLGGVAFLQGVGLEVVRNHHERWDGDGYPDRLEREQIPLGARIFAVADSLDAMTTDRPYRKRRSWDWARDEIVREAGKQFDPSVVAAFEETEGELREIARRVRRSGLKPRAAVSFAEPQTPRVRRRPSNSLLLASSAAGNPHGPGSRGPRT